MSSMWLFSAMKAGAQTAFYHELADLSERFVRLEVVRIGTH